MENDDQKKPEDKYGSYRVEGRISCALLREKIKDGTPEEKKKAQSLYNDHCV